MLLSQLIEAVPGARRVDFRDFDIHQVTDDSRRAGSGDLFVAVRGAAADGHQFVGQAVANGAGAVVLERGDCLPTGVPGLVVEDSRRAVALLAQSFYGCPARHLLPIGVTGTNGKSTTTFLVREILRAADMKPALIGTLGYSLSTAAGGADLHAQSRTTPGALDLARLLRLSVSAGCRSLAMEVSSHALDQERVAGIDFQGAIFTNLTRDHLDYHGTFEGYLDAKARLFEGLAPGAVAVLNRDVAESALLARRTAARVVTYGFTPDADVVGRIDRMTLDGTVFTIQIGAGRYPVHAPLVGRYNVSNMLAASALAYGIGIDAGTIVAGLERMGGVPGRLEMVETGQDFHIVVDYAHTDDALQNMLSTLRRMVRRRLLLVFGAGGDRDATKRAPMGAVAGRYADRIWVTSDNPRHEDPAEIARAVAAGIGDDVEHEIVLGRADAIDAAVAAAGDGDLVVIAGKGHEDYQEIGSRIVPFDDRHVARLALAGRRRRSR